MWSLDPLPYAEDWQARVAGRLVTAEQAMTRLKPGQRIFVATGCGQPQGLVAAAARQAANLVDITFIHLLTIGEAPYALPELADRVHVNSFFIAENVRGVIQQGVGDYTPVFLSDIPRLFTSGQQPIDVALIQVTPPDTRGRCSLGISVDIVKAAVASARLVIAQVNPLMPRTLGEGFLHLDDLDLLVPLEEPLVEVVPRAPDPVSNAVARNVAALVEDGATIELGIGRIPQSVMAHLGNKRDLGIHTEMLTDGVVALVESGVVNGRRKSLDPGRVVVSFCMGSRTLYDHVHNNPVYAFRPTEYVNDPFIISRQHRMTAINVALEVDLTGQVCADTLGGRFFSGIGGQVDFNRGAARSPGGRAIIALPSTAQGGVVSRIVTRLSPGAGVVTSRGDVHYVVTEQGVAYLHGKSVHQRALALISIAHPQFRPQLLREAVAERLVRPDLAPVGERLALGPRELRTSLLLPEGTRVAFRPVHPTDEERVLDLFHGLSEQSVHNRFMGHLKRLSMRQLQDLVFIDHRSAVSVVGTVPEDRGEAIIALGGYFLEPHTNRAEVALMVADRWQGRGIGRFLLNFLVTVARQNGLTGFTATVLPENQAMQGVFAHCGHQVASRLQDGVMAFEITFS